MSRRVILRIISVLFAFNSVSVLLFAFAASSVLSLPKAVQDTLAPLLVISVLPLVFAGVVLVALTSFLRLADWHAMAIASVVVAIVTFVVSVGLWSMKRWAMRMAVINFSAAAGLLAMALFYMLISPDNALIVVGVGWGGLGATVVSVVLMSIGMFGCIWLTIYLMRAARAGRDEYPAPELRLSLRGK